MPNLKKELLMAHKKLKSQSGISLFLTIIIMTILLAIVLGLSTILVGQIKMMREIGYSVIAFYAADAGIERALVQRNNPCGLDGTESKVGEATSTLSVASTSTQPCPKDWCKAENFCIKSVGTYKGVSRAIEITY